MTNQYTVMLRAPDYAEGSNQRDMTIITFVWALTPTHAAHIARGMAAVDNDDFTGHMTAALNQTQHHLGHIFNGRVFFERRIFGAALH